MHHRQEAKSSSVSAPAATAAAPGSSIVVNSKWRANDGFAVTLDSGVGVTPYTVQLLSDIGGTPEMIRIIRVFYTKFHNDAHLRQFLGGLQQPLETHALRLGSYIAEMMGAADRPWHRDLAIRERTPIRLAGGRTAIVADRMSAHHCAWNSVDRPKEKIGRRFKLDDCRVWMRLFFWAVRESGYTDTHPLFLYLRKFIAHFIAIYEMTARAFTVAEAAWSRDQARTDAYLAAGNLMHDVVDVPLREARLVSSTAAGEVQTPSEAESWLYDDAPLASN